MLATIKIIYKTNILFVSLVLKTILKLQKFKDFDLKSFVNLIPECQTFAQQLIKLPLGF